MVSLKVIVFILLNISFLCLTAPIETTVNSTAVVDKTNPTSSSSSTITSTPLVTVANETVIAGNVSSDEGKKVDGPSDGGKKVDEPADGGKKVDAPADGGKKADAPADGDKKVDAPADGGKKVDSNATTTNSTTKIDVPVEEVKKNENTTISSSTTTTTTTTTTVTTVIISNSTSSAALIEDLVADKDKVDSKEEDGGEKDIDDINGEEEEKIIKDENLQREGEYEDTELDSDVDKEYNNIANQLDKNDSENEDGGDAAIGIKKPETIIENKKIDHGQPIMDNEDDNTSSYSFLTYFLIGSVLCVGLYLIFHNKSKIIALVLEGSDGKRRRDGKAYSRLDNLQDVMPNLKK